MRRSVYIETTIISYLKAWPSRDLVRAAEQQITREWWDEQRPKFDLYTAQLVLIEAGAGDAEAAAERLAVLRELPLLDTTERAIQVADMLLASAALPERADRDALHVGVAADNGMDFLLTWNCRHLANAMLRDRIEEVCEEAGLRPPKICTPDELMGAEP
ncbi:MAG: type II toxin-antitoxin system VapC family toxin [Planctomycetes bacterium]|nr:type II toxin-antitoxin system VapC family toxin [Planctomycetota bacterium]